MSEERSLPRTGEVRARARRAREASRLLACLPHARRVEVLQGAADRLWEARSRILEINAREVEVARAEGLSSALVSRLALGEAKVRDMAEGVRAVAALPDPLGRRTLHRLLDEGLVLERRSVPLGVLAVIFEARPDAAVQIAALALKSGNAALLKGGREAKGTVALLLEAFTRSLEAAGLPAGALQALEDREDVDALLNLWEDVDLVIPRGSSELVKSIQARTRIPVLGHAEGICHIYLDIAADEAMALRVVRDAKLQYPAACNSVETLLLHQKAAPRLLPLLVEGLPEVELRGCPACRALVPSLRAATEADWDAEYGAPILALKVVEDLDGALAHIQAHGSGHTEAIVTEDPLSAERFLAEVDASGVYHNASTRFADGYRYGFGAEVGISTARIHARGPVGLEGLLTTKYLLRGAGQIVGEYGGEGGRTFLHRDLED